MRLAAGWVLSKHKLSVTAMRCIIALLCALFTAVVSGAEPVSVAVTPAGSTEQIPATLLAPEGPGPFPAVVMMHDCSGLGPRSSGAPMRWAHELVGQGYVVIVPDSFSTRGFAGGVCTSATTNRQRVNGHVRALDAYGALTYLRARSDVIGARVAVMGGSHGGWTTLAAMHAALETNNALGQAKREPFAAAIALYPSCAPRYGAWSTSKPRAFGPVTGYAGEYQALAPLLILTGEKDDWTPAEPCRELAQRARVAGYPVDIKIYPGAYHSFDSNAPVRYVAQRNNANSPTGAGATTGGDPAAWADAREQVSAFLARHLKPSTP
jgi:dienelactone hydrolase